MNKEADPNDGQQSFKDILGNRIWDLRQYSKGRIDKVLQQALQDKVSPEEVTRRVEALLAEDQPWAEAHRRLVRVSVGDYLRSRLPSGKEDPEIRSAATDIRREFFPDEHPQVAEIEDTAAEMLVDSLRTFTEFFETVQPPATPPAPRERRSSPLDVQRASASSQSAATGSTVSKERRVVDAKINHRKGAWRAHCDNPMRGGCRGDSVDSKMYTRWDPRSTPTSRWSCALQVAGCSAVITATVGTRKTATLSCKIQESRGDRSRSALATSVAGLILPATGMGSSGNCRSHRACSLPPL